MTEQKPPGLTVRNWDLPDDGTPPPPAGWADAVCLNRGGPPNCSRPAMAGGAGEWPAEIEMCNGPNIIVHSRAQHDAIRELMAQNARLAARSEP